MSIELITAETSGEKVGSKNCTHIRINIVISARALGLLVNFGAGWVGRNIRELLFVLLV